MAKVMTREIPEDRVQRDPHGQRRGADSGDMAGGKAERALEPLVDERLDDMLVDLQRGVANAAPATTRRRTPLQAPKTRQARTTAAMTGVAGKSATLPQRSTAGAR